MKDITSILRMAIAIVALPLAATAAAAGYQAMDEDFSTVVLPPEVTSINVATAPLAEVRSHAIRLDSEGRVVGRIVAIADEQGSTYGIGQLKVTFSQMGMVVAEGLTDSDGTFAVGGMSTGVYSFIARSDLGLVAFGINVLPAIEGAEASILEAAAVTSSPSELLGQISKKAVPSQNKINDKIQIISGNHVSLHNGVMTGNIHSMYKSGTVANTKIDIRRGGQVVASTMVQPDGSFKVTGLTTGIYEFVASGVNGYAALSFYAVENGQLTQTVSDTKEVRTSTAILPIPKQDGPSPSFEVILVPQDVINNDQPTVQGDFVGEPFVDGGSFGGGGGAGGGGMGGGRLLGIAGLAIGIIALADGNSTPPPSSPINP